MTSSYAGSLRKDLPKNEGSKMSMQIHEVCSIFPPMSDEELAGLKADIAANGQREPIRTYQGQVIDGRNRLRACEELGIEPRIEEWGGQGSLVAFVASVNLHRRHLTSSQRAVCALAAVRQLEVEAKQRQWAAGGIRGNQHTKGHLSEPVPEIVPEPPGPSAPKARDHSGEARELASRIAGTNARYLQDAKRVEAADPVLLEQVRSGALTPPQAKRAVERAEKRAALEAQAAAAPRSEDPTFRVIEGVSADIMATLEGGSVRLVVADLPYNQDVVYGPHHGNNMDRDDYLAWSEAWLVAARDLLSADGSPWVLISHEYAADIELMLRDRCGLTVRDWITWYESFGVNCARKFNRCSRRLLHAVVDPNQFVFNAEAVTRPSDRQAKYGDQRADPGGTLWDDVRGIDPPLPRLVDNAAERIPDFPTQLPLALLKAVVGCASDPGDLVLDPFSGSGTTGVAALKLGRRYVGIEQSPEFARRSRLRLSTTKGGIDAA